MEGEHALLSPTCREERKNEAKRALFFSVVQRRRKLERVNKKEEQTILHHAERAPSFCFLRQVAVHCLSVCSGWGTCFVSYWSWWRLRCWRLLPTSCLALLELGVSSTSSDCFRLKKCAHLCLLFSTQMCCERSLLLKSLCFKYCFLSAPAVVNTCFWFRLISWGKFTAGTRLSSTPPKGHCGASCLRPLHSHRHRLVDSLSVRDWHRHQRRHH